MSASVLVSESPRSTLVGPKGAGLTLLFTRSYSFRAASLWSRQDAGKGGVPVQRGPQAGCVTPLTLRNALRWPLKAGISNVDCSSTGTDAAYRLSARSGFGEGPGDGVGPVVGEGEGTATEPTNSNTDSVIDCWSENSPADCPWSMAVWMEEASVAASAAMKASWHVEQLARSVALGMVAHRSRRSPAAPVEVRCMPLPPQAIQSARSCCAPAPKTTTNVVTEDAGSAAAIRS